jgi:HEPN domain-containing protein
MPGNRESLSPPDWIRKAKKDLERVRKRLAESDLEDASFHLQQAIEKFLKGYLLSKGWRLKRIHDLEQLLDEAVVVNADLERFRGVCQRVTGYYLIERYPFVTETPPPEEIRTTLRQGEELAAAVMKELGSD